MEDSSNLPAGSVAEIAGLRENQYSRWVDAGVLDEAPYGRCTLIHACSAVLAVELKPHIGRLDVLATALDQLRPDLPVALTAVDGTADVVWDQRDRRATWAFSSTDLFGIVRLARPIVVIPMAVRLAEAQEAFVREVGSAAGRRRLRVVAGGGG